MSKEVVQRFNENVLRYFEGPDPRNRGIGTVMGGKSHQDFRDYDSFQVYNHSEGGVRRAGVPKGAFTGIGEEYQRSSFLLFTRPDSNDMNLGLYVPYGSFIKGGAIFTEVLDEERVERAVEYSVNPIIFSAKDIFITLSDDQQSEYEQCRAQAEEQQAKDREEWDEFNEQMAKAQTIDPDAPVVRIR